MNFQFRIPKKSHFLKSAICFFRKYFMFITGLGLVAAFGRVIQLGGFGPVSSVMNIMLELVVESARILLIFYVLGIASITNGLSRVKRFFTQKESRKNLRITGIQKMKNQWSLILMNFIGFSLIAWGMNYLIDLLAYQTCLYLALKQGGILAPASSEWTILLFFKNLSVIPFTLIFETLFLLWLADRSLEKVNN